MKATQSTTGSAARIVVLDGYTNNPGDLSWEDFARLGALSVYDSTSPAQLHSRCADANILLTNKTVLGSTELAQLPQLDYIGVLATGVNVVDLQAADQHDIAVTNVPDYGSDSVAQHTIALLLACACHITELDRSVHRGEWQRRKVFSYWHQAPVELHGKTLGLIGLGAIGQRTARIAAALGMHVLAYTPSARTDHAGAVRAVTLRQLQRDADAISLHCPLTEHNTQMIDDDFIAQMKAGSMLINTARGGLLDEAAVARALHRGHLSGVGVDVLSSEPPADDNPLLTAPNCLITPHSAWASRASRARLLHIAAANLQAFLAGEQCNRVV